MTQPSVLVLSSRFDLSTDYVVAALEQGDADYLRLNSEDLGSLELAFDLRTETLQVSGPELEVTLSGKYLRAVYNRRPTFLRDLQRVNPEEALARRHWLTFLRGLEGFAAPAWLNLPTSNFLAENKLVQLTTARRVGLQTPDTLITNSARLVAGRLDESVAAKGLDTVLWREGEYQYFGYTEILSLAEFQETDLSAFPIVAQQVLDEKLDIRVTVLEDNLWAAAINSGDAPIEGDWRLLKATLSYERHKLPPGVEAACKELLRELGLVFGAIDLALAHGQYFFLEVNPLGEWAWLQDALDFRIADAIAERLTRSPK